MGLNVFGGRELDIVQQCKEKFILKENEDKIREFIRSLLEVPVKVDLGSRLLTNLTPIRPTRPTRTRGS